MERPSCGIPTTVMLPSLMRVPAQPPQQAYFGVHAVHPAHPLSTLQTPRYHDACKTRSRPACSALAGPDSHRQAATSFAQRNPHPAFRARSSHGSRRCLIRLRRSIQGTLQGSGPLSGWLGVVSHLGIHRPLLPAFPPTKGGPFPPPGFPRPHRYYGPLRPPLRSPRFRGFTAYTVRRSQATSSVGSRGVSLLGRRRVSPVPSLAFSPFHALYAAGFFGAASPSASPLPWPSPTDTRLGSRLAPSRGENFTTRQASLHAADR